MSLDANNWTEIESEIKKTLDSLETQRQESRVKTAINGTLIGLTLGVIGLICSHSPIAILITLAFSYGIIYSINHNKRNKIYKTEVMPKIVNSICPGATYEPEGTLTKDMILSSHLINMPFNERFINEDTIRGKVGSTSFVYGEVKLYHRESNGKQSYEVVDFKGFVFEADFNKYFNGITTVTSKCFRTRTIGFLSSLKRCNLEDVNFEERYNTFTSNDQEARYILTPSLQMRIMEMHDEFCSKLKDNGLAISFHDNKMLIMVPSSTNRFEVKYRIEDVKSDFLALRLTISIVEMLNLNLRIWTKE